MSSVKRCRTVRYDFERERVIKSVWGDEHESSALSFRAGEGLGKLRQVRVFNSLTFVSGMDARNNTCGADMQRTYNILPVTFW